MDAHEEGLFHDFIDVCVEERMSEFVVSLASNEQCYLPQRDKLLRGLRAKGRSDAEISKLTGISTRHLRRIRNGGNNK